MVDRYISIPYEVDVLRFTVNSLSELVLFTECSNFELSKKGDLYNCLITIKGKKLLVIEGNYIIKEKDGNIVLMTEDIFNKSYIKKE